MDNKIKIDGEPSCVTDIRERILESFKDLVFEEGPHKYFLNGNELPSVSHMTHSFEEEVDFTEVASNYAEKNGHDAQYWLDQWKFKNLKATTTGTMVHEYGESLGWLRNGHPEFITEANKVKYIKDKQWLIPTRPKEEAILKFFNELNKDLHFVLAETKVYTGKNRELTDLKQDYAGTFDLLMYYDCKENPEKSGLVLMDYKTNASLRNTFNRTKGKMLLAPFGDMFAESLSLYTLQLSAYQIPLEDIGLSVVARRIIWLRDNGEYELIPVNNVTKQLRDVWSKKEE